LSIRYFVFKARIAAESLQHVSSVYSYRIKKNMNLIITSSILFAITFAGGLAAILLSKNQNLAFKHVLTFSGAYLFSITITHLLPEIFTLEGGTGAHSLRQTAVFLLLGFFLQHFLQQFSSGTEHGHFHDSGQHAHHHNILPIVAAMFFHSFLEGMLLMHPGHAHEGHQHHEHNIMHASSLLIGIIMHKIPEAFAFATVIHARQGSFRKTFIFVLIYSLCSPAGAFTGDIFLSGILSEEQTNYVFALVAGSFLHISTTIFFENNPQHLFDARKLSVILLGALCAVITDNFLH
jgi:zinc transporter ZupT